MAPKDAVADVLGAAHQLPAESSRIDFDWNSLIKYRTSKFLNVNVWQLGAASMLIQLGLVGYVGWHIFYASEWADVKDVHYHVEAWVGDGARQSVVASSMPYCGGNASYEYELDAESVYVHSECREHAPHAVSSKQPEMVFVTTMYTEETAIGWRCDAPDAAVRMAACAGEWSAHGLQCTCVTRATVYPLGVEAMNVSFRHSYAAPEATGSWLRGDSNIPRTGDPTGGGLLPLDTHFGDGTSYDHHESGGPITHSVAELLAMAGVSLDAINRGEAADAMGRRPMYRMTGVLIHVRTT